MESDLREFIKCPFCKGTKYQRTKFKKEVTTQMVTTTYIIHKCIYCDNGLATIEVNIKT